MTKGQKTSPYIAGNSGAKPSLYSKSNSPLTLPKKVREVDHYYLYDSELESLWDYGALSTLFFTLAGMGAAFLLGVLWDCAIMDEMQLRANTKTVTIIQYVSVAVTVIFFALGLLVLIKKELLVNRIKKQHGSPKMIENSKSEELEDASPN